MPHDPRHLDADELQTQTRSLRALARALVADERRSKGVRPRSGKKGARGKGKDKSFATPEEAEAYVRSVEKTLKEMPCAGKLTDEQFESKMRGLPKMLAGKKGSPGKAKKK